MGVTKLVLPVVVGAMSGVILITLGEKGLHYLYPLPPGINFSDKNAIATAIAQMPVTAFLLLLVNYMVCSFLAGAIASIVAGGTFSRPAIVVGVALTLSGIFNLVMISHPVWFSLLSCFCYLPFAYLGYLAVKKQKIAAGRS